MTTCRLRITFPTHDRVRRIGATLDRCATDGIWFDDRELARVFELAHRAITFHGG